MLYVIAHLLRNKIPWVWKLVDLLNSFLFSLRYGRKLKEVVNRVLAFYQRESGLKVVPMAKVATEKLVEFFAKQPDDAYTFFKPHGFDAKSIKKNQKNKSFLAYVLFENNEVVAYCFIRSFFHGKGFRGRMVDIDHRGKGLGTLMNKVMNEIGFGMGLRLYETVSKDNVASYRSAISASNVKIVEEMENNELYLEILPE
ncbi:hypothetical protein HMPREF1981_00024 [Bacteroides pyogenes F0041]|uniref:N-acetyltransferase domain-containing protein n=2 Tax=Bacteroides pyogenes TaxID=310300 RepID=U2CZ05_9BACE|nr:hypothetical protein HMPREF1981_00024 [Bacteroides pyogenes F0041]